MEARWVIVLVLAAVAGIIMLVWSIMMWSVRLAEDDEVHEFDSPNASTSS